jgi:cytochrome P450
LTDTASASASQFPDRRSPGCPFDPAPEYADFRTQTGIPKVHTPSGIEPYVVTGYERVRTLLGEPSLSSRGAASMHAQQGHDFDAPINTGNILQLDGPAHDRWRRLLIPEFTVKRMQALRPYIAEIINTHIDAMLARTGPIDLIAEFALPVPSLVICELLAVPYADRDKFQTWASALMDTGLTREVQDTPGAALIGYMAQLCAGRLENPTENDLIGRLILRAREAGDNPTLDELWQIAIILLVAGHETTANMIGLSIAALLDHPDKITQLRENPELVESAVEEMLRYLTVIHFGVLRYTTEDITVGENTIPKDSWVVASLVSGNRDEKAFPDPDTIHLTRDAATHLAFGFGMHQCLGQQLARVELREVFSTLFRRIPDLRLAVPLDEVPFKNRGLVYGAKSLPVTCHR